MGIVHVGARVSIDPILRSHMAENGGQFNHSIRQGTSLKQISITEIIHSFGIVLKSSSRPCQEHSCQSPSRMCCGCRRSLNRSVSNHLMFSHTVRTYDLLIYTTVLLGILTHGATELLLSSIEALIEVVLLRLLSLLLLRIHFVWRRKERGITGISLDV